MIAVHLILFLFMVPLWWIWRFVCVWSIWIAGDCQASLTLTDAIRSLDRISKKIGGPIPVDIMSKITHAVFDLGNCC